MTEENYPRRKFLARTIKAGAAIGILGGVSSLLYDRRGPRSESTAKKLESLGDFSVAQKPGKAMAVVSGSQRVQTLRKAIDLLGTIERFVQPGQTVAIKPNVAFASPPMLGATAHPELVAEIVRLCYDRAKAKKVYVLDNPINDPKSCFEISGIGKAAENFGAEIVLPEENLFENITIEDASLIKNWPVFYKPLEKIDRLIGITPVKDHMRSGASMTMKNWYGLLGGQRSIFHQDINTIIAELAMMVKPTLVILDGTQVMTTNGPTGGSLSDLKTANKLIVSCDQVAADSYGCGLLGLKTADLPYLTKARKAGSGTTDYETLKPIFASIE